MILTSWTISSLSWRELKSMSPNLTFQLKIKTMKCEFKLFLKWTHPISFSTQCFATLDFIMAERCKMISRNIAIKVVIVMIGIRERWQWRHFKKSYDVIMKSKKGPLQIICDRTITLRVFVCAYACVWAFVCVFECMYISV